ncbi:MAG TPA: GNAT family N-acetyltransferase [Burkholderiales bacterium]|nr:GNAT family N-acetyltransferase [Burkholderiales bacterium]
MSAAVEWRWYALEDLSGRQAYAIFAAREAVFVVEQSCAYQELDEFDKEALHLVAWDDAEVAAYLRVLAPGTRFNDPSIGRLLVDRDFRRSGLARKAMEMALKKIYVLYPAQAVRISAQTYLEAFYASIGFVTVSDVYAEDGIPHVEMRRSSL